MFINSAISKVTQRGLRREKVKEKMEQKPQGVSLVTHRDFWFIFSLRFDAGSVLDCHFTYGRCLLTRP
jgi:hypothetical protein